MAAGSRIVKAAQLEDDSRREATGAGGNKCRAKIIRRSVPDGLPPVHVQSLRHDVVFYYPMSLTVKLSLV